MPTPGRITAGEIYHQPLLWRDTFRRMQHRSWRGWAEGSGVLCGAGTSAYAADAIRSAWPASRMVATTDLLTDPRVLKRAHFMLSIARSGDSPESIGAVNLARRDFPSMPQLAITCNPNGQLARDGQIEVLLLDERTNDRSLVMTSSFSNLVLAGLCLSHRENISDAPRRDLPSHGRAIERTRRLGKGSRFFASDARCGSCFEPSISVGARELPEDPRNDGRSSRCNRRNISWAAPRSNEFP